MTDETFRPDTAREAAERAETVDPTREWLDESVARPEAWPEPRSAVREQQQPVGERRRGTTGEVVRGAANLAFTAYFVNEIANSDGGAGDSGGS
jgi:hypothetical protein